MESRHAFDRIMLCGIIIQMMFPGLLLLFVFAYLPMFGIIIAFKDYRASQGVLGSAWVGFQNFFYLFQTDDARRIVFNTVTKIYCK